MRVLLVIAFCFLVAVAFAEEKKTDVDEEKKRDVDYDELLKEDLADEIADEVFVDIEKQMMNGDDGDDEENKQADPTPWGWRRRRRRRRGCLGASVSRRGKCWGFAWSKQVKKLEVMKKNCDKTGGKCSLPEDLTKKNSLR